MTRAPKFTPVDLNHLVRLAECMAVHLNRSETTIANWMEVGPRFFSRLRANKGCNAQTYNHVFFWFSANWPADLEWPNDTPRPDINEAARRAS